MTKRILVVDDEKYICTALDFALTTEGYSVTTSNNPEEAIQLLSQTEESKKYDLLITDLYMPEVDGLALIKQARCSLPKIPCVLVSAFLSNDVKERLTEYNGTIALEKPLNIGEIRTLVKKMI